MKNNLTNDYVYYAGFRDYIKIISSLTKLTTLILKTTSKNNFSSDYTNCADFKDYKGNNFTSD